MKSGTILTLSVGAFLTQGCGVSNALSVRPDPLPQDVAEQCPDAVSFLRRGGTVADAELMVLNLGLALNECGDEKQIAVAAYDETRNVLIGQKTED